MGKLIPSFVICIYPNVGMVYLMHESGGRGLNADAFFQLTDVKKTIRDVYVKIAPVSIAIRVHLYFCQHKIHTDFPACGAAIILQRIMSIPPSCRRCSRLLKNQRMQLIRSSMCKSSMTYPSSHVNNRNLSNCQIGEKLRRERLREFHIIPGENKKICQGTIR